jgi:apolipoprotein N-acyltransferase
MIALLCALAGGGLFFLSTGLGTIWPLAWIAPVPVLWLAYGARPNWQILLASFTAYAIGELNLLEAYGVMAPMIAVVIAISASIFAGAVLFARLAQRRLPPLLAVLAFPALWTGLDYLIMLVSPNGSFGSLAYSQVPAPLLIQSPSVFGLWSVTFLLCLVPNALALLLHQGRRAAMAGIVVAILFAANAGFGYVRLAAPNGPVSRVGAIADDSQHFGGTHDAAVAVATRYADAARALAAQGATTIVLPEKVAALQPDWTDVTAPLALAARETGSRIVVSVEEHADQDRNLALTFAPDGTVARYAKRHLVPGLERLAPGDAPGLLGGSRAVVICKDMDFPATIRGDARHGIGLMFVPAWDFDADRDIHANMAILRGVEDGFALVRAARDGLLTASDAQGRVIAAAPTSSDGIVTILADLPQGAGDTIYLRIGDSFAWFCLGLATMLAAGALLRRRGDKAAIDRAPACANPS